MKLLTRLCVCAIVTATLLTTLLHLAASCFGEQENVLQLGRLVVLEARRTEALLQRSDMVTRSMELKKNATAELLAGRLALVEAVALFEEANQLIKNTDPDLVPPYQVPTTTEGVYRQVLSWVRGEVSLHSTEQTERFFVSLVREFESAFGPLETTLCPLESVEKWPELLE